MSMGWRWSSLAAATSDTDGQPLTAFAVHVSLREVLMFRILPIGLLALLLTSPLLAQRAAGPERHHPDFSGTWVMDPARSESARAPDANRITSATVTIAQTPEEVRLDSIRNGVHEFARYPLVAPESPRAVGTTGSVGSVVEWDGDTLITLTPHEVNGMAVTTTERRTLSANRKEMTVVTSLQIQHGYQGQNAQNYSAPVTDVYILTAK